MNRSYLALLGSMLLTLTACASLSSNRTVQANIEVETIPSSGVTISQTEVYQRDGLLVVNGQLRRPHEVKFAGHIDILLCTPSGDEVSKEVSLPRLSSKRKGVIHIPFTTRFEGLPEPGSKLIVRYHASLDEAHIQHCL